MIVLLLGAFALAAILALLAYAYERTDSQIWGLLLVGGLLSLLWGPLGVLCVVGLTFTLCAFRAFWRGE